MTDRNLNIRVAFDAINKLSRPASAAQKSTAALADQVKSTQSALKGMERNAASFDRLSKASAKTSQQLAEAKKQAEAMRASFGPAKQRTDEQTAALNKQSGAIRQLTRAHNEEQAKLGSLRSSLLQHGVLLKGDAAATEQITRRTGEYNRQLSEQQRRLAAVSRAQAQHQKTKEASEKLASGGMKAVMTGVAIEAPVIGAVASYASMENSMKDVAKQVNALRDDNGQRTAQFYELQSAIKAASENMPLENGAQDFAALVAGGARMGASNSDDPWEKQKADLLSFANTAAMAAKAFELPAGQLSEDMGKIAGLYKIPTQDIERLGDAINYLDDNAKSKGSEIIDVLQRVGGVADKLDYKKAAALGSTFLTLGAAPEVAASATNAMVRELAIATTQSDNFMDGLDAIGLSAEKIQKSMSVDAMGTIITVLEATRKLAPDKQTSVLTQIFGKEFGSSASKLSNNLDELYRQLALVNSEASKGSMRRESEIDKDSVSSQYLLAKTSLNNSFSSLGETLRGPAIEVMKYVAEIAQSFRAWVEANPATVAALMKTAAVLGVVIASLGALALTVAGILLPMGALRLSLTLLTGGRGFGAFLPSLGGMTSKLKNLGPLLSGAGRSIKDWTPIFNSARTAASNLGNGILTIGRNGIGLLTRMGGAAGSALTTLFTSPRVALSALGNGLRTLATGGFGTLLTIGRTVLTVLGGGLSFLLSPIGLLVAALAGAALMIWRYWEPISSFFSGFWSGLVSGLAPVKQAFAPLAPIFDSIGSAIGRVWNWFKSLFEPVNTSAETLRECTEAGRAFGEIVGKAISGVVSVILKVAEGIGWLLKKLGAIPEAANAAKEVANTMDATEPQKKAPVMWVWDNKQKKFVAQTWKESPAEEIKKAADNAPKPPAGTTPPPETTAPPGVSYDSLKGSNGIKEDSSTTAAAEAAKDPNKLGEIVFKNRPPVIPVSGAWSEPTMQAQSPVSKMGATASRIGEMVRGIATWPTRALSSAMPVPVAAGRSDSPAGYQRVNAAAPANDTFNLTLNIYDAGKMDEKALVALFRREYNNMQRERESRRRSQLSDFS